MRYIRGDLQERANYIETQISAAGTDFEETVLQLQRKLKAQLAALDIAHDRTARLASGSELWES
jgi:hypothetical protein